MNGIELDTITRRVLDAAARGDAMDAIALTFLLRRYRAVNDDPVDEALGAALDRALSSALADALARHLDERDTAARAGWLTLFSEAATLSEDSRLVDAARELIAVLVAEWPSITVVGAGAVSIDACLRATHLVDPRELIPVAIDELERVVGGAYRPGQGVAHSVGTQDRGGFGDHVRAASALLSAFEVTGRLPYSMLAEELMQTSRTMTAEGADFAMLCEAARVLCRLAALHDDAEYRGAAVMATTADYHADAEQLLARAAAAAASLGARAAIYGIALGEWRAAGNARRKSP